MRYFSRPNWAYCSCSGDQRDASSLSLQSATDCERTRWRWYRLRFCSICCFSREYAFETLLPSKHSIDHRLCIWQIKWINFHNISVICYKAALRLREECYEIAPCAMLPSPEMWGLGEGCSLRRGARQMQVSWSGSLGYRIGQGKWPEDMGWCGKSNWRHLYSKTHL